MRAKFDPHKEWVPAKTKPPRNSIAVLTRLTRNAHITHQPLEGIIPWNFPAAEALCANQFLSSIEASAPKPIPQHRRKQQRPTEEAAPPRSVSLANGSYFP